MHKQHLLKTDSDHIKLQICIAWIFNDSYTSCDLFPQILGSYELYLFVAIAVCCYCWKAKKAYQ